MGVSRAAVLEGMGRILGQIHSVVVPAEKTLVSYTQGGAVELFRHTQEEFVRDIRSRGNSEFTILYEEELALFRDIEILPCGIIHGDPFMDNFLLDRDSLSVVGVVDFEDACVGPLIFDIGSAIAGSCFASTQEGRYELDWPSVEALMRGYGKHRRLTEIESQNIVRWIRIALLLNCAFRFLMYFGRSENSDAYRDLYEKLVYMRTDVVAKEQRISSLARQ
jgi:Ser/Thr protein kinase RdoA (MazF antagonist)